MKREPSFYRLRPSDVSIRMKLLQYRVIKMAFQDERVHRLECMMRDYLMGAPDAVTPNQMIDSPLLNPALI